MDESMTVGPYLVDYVTHAVMKLLTISLRAQWF